MHVNRTVKHKVETKNKRRLKSKGRKWIGTQNLELILRDSKAGCEPISLNSSASCTQHVIYLNNWPRISGNTHVNKEKEKKVLAERKDSRIQMMTKKGPLTKAKPNKLMFLQYQKGPLLLFCAEPHCNILKQTRCKIKISRYIVSAHVVYPNICGVYQISLHIFQNDSKQLWKQDGKSTDMTNLLQKYWTCRISWKQINPGVNWVGVYYTFVFKCF